MRGVLVLAVLALAAPAAQGATVQQKMRRYALAEARIGVREVPAHSNLGPDIARYHTAVRHARADEVWCAIFVSYIARKAGYPLGSVGQGAWQVQSLFKWAKQRRWYFAKGARKVRVGDIALHGYGHSGIVVRIDKGGRIWTVDGNWGDTVRYQPLPSLSVTGYLRLPSTPRAR
jgi:hypothetical protein